MLVGETAIKVLAAEILLHRSVLELVVNGGKNRGGDSDDRLLRAAPGFDAVELRLQVTVFLLNRRPGTNPPEETSIKSMPISRKRWRAA